MVNIQKTTYCLMHSKRLTNLPSVRWHC